MGDARLAVKVSADAKEASAAFSALAKDIKAVGTESVGVTEGVAKVDAAMAKLARAPDTPKALATAIAKATIEIEDFRKELDKTPASAEKMKAITAALAQADSALKASTERAGRLKDAMADVGQTAKNTGDKFDAARSASGGLTASFESMRNTGTGLTATIGKVGAGISILSAGIGGAVATGQQLAQWITDASDKYDAYTAKVQSAALKTQLYEIAVRAAAKGTIEMGNSVNETIQNYVKMTVALGKLDEQSRAYIAGVAGLKIPQTFEQLGRQGEAMEIALRGAFKRSTEDGRLFVAANSKELHAYMEAMKVAGKSISSDLVEMVRSAESFAKANTAIAAAMPSMIEEIKKASRATNDNAKAQKEAERAVLALSVAQHSSLLEIANVITKEFDRKTASEASTKAYETLILAISRLINEGQNLPADIEKEIELRKKLDDALRKDAAAYDRLSAAVAVQREREAAAANVTSPVVGQFEAVHDAAVGAAAAAGQFGTDLDHVAKMVVAAGGQLSTGVQMWLRITEATDEATAALLRYMEATKAMTAQQTESLAATKGWTDYVIALKDGYESGTTSLYNYITELVRFKVQLEQIFGGVTGKAKEELTAMIDLIEKLIQTAGDSTPESRGGGYTGQFQRDANGG